MSKSSIISQLPLLKQFTETAPTSLNIASDIGISSLTAVLGPIVGAQTPLGFGQWLCQSLIRLGSRKSKVCSILQHESNRLIKALYAPESRKKLHKAIFNSSSKTKKRLAQIKKLQPNFNCIERVHRLNCQGLEVLTKTPNASFLDLNALIGVQRSVDVRKEELAERRRVHADWLLRMERDEAWSRQMLREMVNPRGID